VQRRLGAFIRSESEPTFGAYSQVQPVIVPSAQDSPPNGVLLKCSCSAEARGADQSRSLPRLRLVQLHALSGGLTASL